MVSAVCVLMMQQFHVPLYFLPFAIVHACSGNGSATVRQTGGTTDDNREATSEVAAVPLLVIEEDLCKTAY